MGLFKHLKETKDEFSHVNWPSRQQTITYTVIVLVVSLVIAYYLGLFDWIFAQGLATLISL